MPTDNFWTYFFEIYETLPRQGPGDRESTERALGFLPRLRKDQRILDIGCGSGTQTIDLANATEAQIVALDKHAPFVDTLAKRTEELNLGTKITAQVGDMNDIQFPDGSFDVIWSEGAIFIIGFANGLDKWRRLIAPDGYLVVSEFCWFDDNPPDELKAILIDGCPDAANRDARRKDIAASGYRLLGEFELPEVGWWDNFYLPLAQRLERFRKTHVKNPDALEVASNCQQEIDMFQKYPGSYGYVFFILQPD